MPLSDNKLQELNKLYDRNASLIEDLIYEEKLEQQFNEDLCDLICGRKEPSDLQILERFIEIVKECNNPDSNMTNEEKNKLRSFMCNIASLLGMNLTPSHSQNLSFGESRSAFFAPKHQPAPKQVIMKMCPDRHRPNVQYLEIEFPSEETQAGFMTMFEQERLPVGHRKLSGLPCPFTDNGNNRAVVYIPAYMANGRDELVAVFASNEMRDKFRQLFFPGDSSKPVHQRQTSTYGKNGVLHLNEFKPNSNHKYRVPVNDVVLKKAAQAAQAAAYYQRLIT